ncbi:hypothetical protein DEJ51_01605 [Streptomyces venezuelae]|uniref:Uncharacterized protein n=1 Tax=Streptomyces venezuelae TaxID=54571 RepID=A0A5P2DDE9_STRVZ|nr:hypothetical protein [Streptomyces venezuelae]QES53112.1 hypothetical protein DEJ51_01605 [Streptomyces venezuelae]
MCCLLACWGAYRLWNGGPYPEVDPHVVATRLAAEAERVENDLALPVGPGPLPDRMETGACYYRGLRSLAHIDQARRDVRSFSLERETTGIAQDTARAAQERVRSRLTRQGWKPVSQNVSPMGFRFENQDTGDQIDVDWYEPTGTLVVLLHAPCGKIPDGHPLEEPSRSRASATA